jgi:putative hydrolase of the HAD superfamily
VVRELPGLRAVLFDIYGTMFISGSGDVGVAQESGRPDALAAAFRAAGFRGRLDAERGVQCMLSTIRSHHDRERSHGIDYPEVDILEVWRDCIDEMTRQDWMDSVAADFDLRQLAVEYEVRTNATWPMPGLLDCLDQLREAGLIIGIISNAQFYTLQMFLGLLGATPEGLGFDPEMQFYSFRHLRAKPGTFLFELAVKALAKCGVAAEKVIYIGNDMLNDVQAAQNVGFRTALFAGDRRSLRWRTDDDRVQGVTPDVVLTDLKSLAACLPASPGPAD